MPKTVIEIEILDEKFKAFSEAFENFKKSVKDAESKVEELGDKAEQAGNKGKNAFVTYKKTMDEFKRSTEGAYSSLAKFALTAADIAKSAASAALSFAKWLTFGALGSGFGLGAIGANAVGTQTTAAGFGVSSGNLRAARMAYGQMGIDVDSILANITKTKLDPTAGFAYSLFGVQGQRNMSATDILAQILRGSRNIDQGNPEVLNQISKLGFDQYSINQLKRQSPEDIESAIRLQRQKAPQYETDEKGWAGFMRALDDASEVIQTSLIKNLNVLTPALGDLARTISKDIDQGLKSGAFKEWMIKARDGIKEFATYIGSDEFKYMVKSFFYSLTDLAISIGKVASFIDHPLTAAKEWLKRGEWDIDDNQKNIIKKYSSSKEYKDLPLGMLENLMKVKIHNDPNAYNTTLEMNEGVAATAEELKRNMAHYSGIKNQETMAYMASYVKGGIPQADAMAKQNFSSQLANYAAYQSKQAGGGYSLKIDFTSDTSGSAAAQLQSLGSHDALAVFSAAGVNVK